MPETLLIHDDGPVRHVTLNRPDSRNAMSLQMVDELIAALEQAEVDKVRVLVLRGAEGHFCSGGDIKDMGAAQTIPPGQEDSLVGVNARFGQLCLAYAQSGLPIIAVLDGAVLGGGFGLACVADVVLARETALFRLPETGLGLVPAQIAPFLVERLGYSQARRLAVTGGKIDATAAQRLGLVHYVCDGEDALQAALAQVVTDICKGAPGAIATTKQLVREAFHHSAESLYQKGAEAFAKAARSEEATEGLTAFLEKRPARWVKE